MLLAQDVRVKYGVQKMNVEYVEETKIVYFRRIGSYGIENRELMQSFKRWVKSENLFQG